MEVAIALAVVAVVAVVVLFITRRNSGDGPGASGPQGGGNSRPGTGKH